MQSIIKDIYLQMMDRNVGKRGQKEKREKANEVYNRIEKTLSEEQKALLEDYVNKSADFHADEEREMYFRGFKTGVLLMIEVLNFQKEE